MRKKRATNPEKRRRPRKDPAASKAYDHPKEKLLLRPDVGLQPQFRQTKPPTKYRYDPSLDPTLSGDINADRERGEALIAGIERAKDLEEARAAAAQLRHMSRPFLNWAGRAERHGRGSNEDHL